MKHCILLLAFVAGCSAGGDEDDATPIEEYACVHIIEGDIVDAAATRDDAPEITPGRAPYRVNLLPQDAPGFLRFQSDGGPLVLLSDFLGATPAVWTGETRAELPAGVPDASCDEDIPSVQDVAVGAGEHFLEVGPAYQANIWILLGS